MALQSPGFVAGGTIQPCRVVKSDATNPFTVTQASARTDKPLGISQEGSHDAPGTVGAATDAARSGQPITVFGNGDQCLAEVGAAVTVGDALEADGNGRVITCTFAVAGNAWLVGTALESAANANERIRIAVRIQSIRPA